MRNLNTICVDSIEFSNININPSYNLSYNTSICEGEIFNGLSINQDTILKNNFKTKMGCDSNITTNVKVNKASKPSILQVNFCDEGIYDGIKYTSSSTVSKKYKNYLGCDSNFTYFVKINLSAKFEKDTVIYLSETYKNKKYDTIGTFKNENKFPKAASNGCDSIFTENIIVKAKSSIEEDLNFANLLVSPNPANEIINLNLKDITYNQIELINLFGKVIYKTSFEQINSNSVQINSKEIESGTYFVKINSNNIFKFIKIIVIH